MDTPAAAEAASRRSSAPLTAAIGLGATFVLAIMALDKSDFIPFITPAFVTFLVGIGVIVNGLLFTVPRKQLPGEAYDALSQQVLDSGSNRIPYEAPAQLTSELPSASRLQAASVTEHTTHHLKSNKP